MDRIQLRILLNCGEKCEPLREFELKKKKYKILAKSKKRHLIPTLVPIGGKYQRNWTRMEVCMDEKDKVLSD